MDSSEFSLYVDRFLNDIEQQLDELELDIDLPWALASWKLSSTMVRSLF